MSRGKAEWGCPVGVRPIQLSLVERWSLLVAIRHRLARSASNTNVTYCNVRLVFSRQGRFVRPDSF